MSCWFSIELLCVYLMWLTLPYHPAHYRPLSKWSFCSCLFNVQLSKTQFALMYFPRSWKDASRNGLTRVNNQLPPSFYCPDDKKDTNFPNLYIYIKKFFFSSVVFIFILELFHGSERVGEICQRHLCPVCSATWSLIVKYGVWYVIYIFSKVLSRFVIVIGSAHN